ncbi:MAG TPA: tRNA pseudouridine(55) synthase TruB [Nitrospirales bacterium]|nr:tRNA pseudouridine(55) synthase TruB [Nitrospirales bacterium]HIB54435.1 tRNA pseudouridine(55) synthase TruB [Nitrospirales bacterium]HIC05266.1 tRNA pseudouridine(55) synthase TruB [Nitrospirales bacterium]HIO69971.1 tRNA pseudouridine(55) synthase TruB [Nitrospirales bacterium]
MDGILNIDKPPGWTSHDIVAKLRRLLNIRKIGHTGTLDPAATGVLLICIGKATRVAEYLVEREKEYRAVLRLGEATDTQDGTGQVIERHDAGGITETRLRAVIQQFTGNILQVPPMYSAIKINGVALYKLARAGQTIPRSARAIHVSHIGIGDIRGRDVTLDVTCSKGTYIRTLCHDVGAALGVGGHLHQLTRLRVGSFLRAHALTIETVEQLHREQRLESSLYHADDVLHDFPAVDVIEPTVTRVRHGGGVRAEEVTAILGAGTSGMLVRIREFQRGLLALGRLSYPIGELGRPGDTRLAVSIEKVLV